MVILPQHSIGAQIPQPVLTNQRRIQTGRVVIQLEDPGKGTRPDLRINPKEPVSWEEPGARLQAIYRLRDEKTALVKGDPEVEFRFVAAAAGIAHGAGAAQVVLLGSSGKQ